MNNEKLKNLKKVKSFDYGEFDGVKTTIENVTLTEVETKDFGEGEQEVQQIIVETMNVGDNEEKPTVGREFISLKKDVDGIFGIPENANSKAMKFLKYFEVSTFDELIGKKCMIVVRVNTKDKKTLGIHYGGN